MREEEEQRMKTQIKQEDDDLFGDAELSGYNSSFAGSKRDISQVDSPEEVHRPHPSFVVLTSFC